MSSLKSPYRKLGVSGQWVTRGPKRSKELALRYGSGWTVNKRRGPYRAKQCPIAGCMKMVQRDGIPRHRH